MTALTSRVLLATTSIRSRRTASSRGRGASASASWMLARRFARSGSSGRPSELKRGEPGGRVESDWNECGVRGVAGVGVVGEAGVDCAPLQGQPLPPNSGR